VAEESSGEVYRAAHDAIVVALPAPAAADLLEPLSTDLAAALRTINYYPAAVVLAEYDRPVFGEQVRARVFPPNSPLSNAGAYGVKDRHIVRYTFSGRAYRTADPDETALLDLAEGQLAKEIDLSGVTRVRAVSKRWEHAYCGYSWFHSKTIQRLDQVLQGIDRIALTGDYLRGASIEACFRAAFERTDSLTSMIHARADLGRRGPGSRLWGLVSGFEGRRRPGWRAGWPGFHGRRVVLSLVAGMAFRWSGGLWQGADAVPGGHGISDSGQVIGKL